MYFSQNLWALMQLHRLTAAQLAKELSLPEATVQAWLENRQEPTAAQFTAVRQFFSVTIDQLLDTPEPFVPGERYVVSLDGKKRLSYWKSYYKSWLKPEMLTVISALSMLLVMLIIREDFTLVIFNIVFSIFSLYKIFRSISTYKEACRDLPKIEASKRSVYLFRSDRLCIERWNGNLLEKKGEYSIKDMELIPVRRKEAFVLLIENALCIMEHRMFYPNSSAIHFFDPAISANKKHPYSISSLVGPLWILSYNLGIVFLSMPDYYFFTSRGLVLLPLLASFLIAVVALIFSFFEKKISKRIFNIIISGTLLLLTIFYFISVCLPIYIIR